MVKLFIILQSPKFDWSATHLDFGAINTISRNEFKSLEDAEKWLEHDSNLSQMDKENNNYIIQPIYRLSW